MKATEILMEEHRVIERVLTTLEKATDRVEAGRPVNPDVFIDAAQFVKGFADGCHHRKEENVLFKAIEASGVPTQGGPVGAMLADHEQGRTYTRAMAEAAQQWKAGDASARQNVIRNARGYTMLLRQHIAKEDGILFPLADRVIAPPQQEAVAEGFEHVEHEETGAGVHEKYLALADRLEKEVA